MHVNKAGQAYFYIQIYIQRWAITVTYCTEIKRIRVYIALRSTN